MASDKTDLINLENAGVRRENRWLVRGIDLRIRKGEIVTIIGPNGAGKALPQNWLLARSTPTKAAFNAKLVCVSVMSHKSCILIQHCQCGLTGFWI